MPKAVSELGQEIMVMCVMLLMTLLGCNEYLFGLVGVAIRLLVSQ